MTMLLELDELTKSTHLTVGHIARDEASRRHRFGSAPTIPARSGGPLGTVQPSGGGLRQLGVARFVAPSRFDVHRIDDFSEWVAGSTEAGATSLVVDLSKVDFIDLAAIEAIADVRERHHVLLVDLSLAALVTFRLVDSAVGSSPEIELAEAA